MRNRMLMASGGTCPVAGKIFLPAGILVREKCSRNSQPGTVSVVSPPATGLNNSELKKKIRC